jgi:putative FmdB family regulatory protein
MAVAQSHHWRKNFMPNYEYQCKACNNKFEIWQAVGEAAPPCPECAGEVKKILHVPKLHFKGSGFYVTDLRAEKSAAKTPAKCASGECKTDGTCPSTTEKPAESTATATAHA